MKILDLLVCNNCGNPDFKPIGIYDDGNYQVECTSCQAKMKVPAPGPLTIYSETELPTEIFWGRRDTDDE